MVAHLASASLRYCSNCKASSSWSYTQRAPTPSEGCGSSGHWITTLTLLICAWRVSSLSLGIRRARDTRETLMVYIEVIQDIYIHSCAGALDGFCVQHCTILSHTPTHPHPRTGDPHTHTHPPTHTTPTHTHIHTTHTQGYLIWSITPCSSLISALAALSSTWKQREEFFLSENQVYPHVY